MRRPNILILMVDQLSGTFFPDGPAAFLHAPNLARLAERSTRFDNAYCPSPLCAPARAGVMTGRLPSGSRVWDNAAEFAADLPTFAHWLRRAGYRTTLCGKMHFVGPDQLHGFEERLTTDIYPADFGWTPDWRKPGARVDWWYHNMGSVTGAGVAEVTNQYDYDDEVAFLAERKVWDLAREGDGAPWLLTVSFTHPHDPFVARRRWWDLYEGCDRLAPETPALPYDAHDPHARRLLDAADWREGAASEAQVAAARRAYFANVSYIDDRIGAILGALAASGQEAAVVFLSDHGEMLGERGLWYKMSFYEGSARVPLMIAAPGLAPGRVETPVSTLDLAPTLAALAEAQDDGLTPWLDGEDLAPVAGGAARSRPVAMEYMAEGSVAPMVALRSGRWKYTACPADPEQLFDLAADPAERTNCAEDTACADVLADMRAAAAARWDLAAIDAAVRDSQARRLSIDAALRTGRRYPWDFQPLQAASERFMRNHLDLNDLEARRRWPQEG
ncbi:MAG: choline-sulfatase [Rhodobacteraceae bacterium]|nr:MAG: choline-sulfatase [Paracoccaceae bacterium]